MKPTNTKKDAAPKKRGKYDEKLKAKGSFMDLINSTIEHTDKNTTKAKAKK